ncbi:MAG: L-threonylcarbamoyladenylate synthase, partial [Acidobacteriaceae bacterium]
VKLLIEKFWPGPLTLLLPKLDAVPSVVTAGRKLVGVRMPAHPVALALIAACNVPVAAPSANRFGHTSSTTAQHVVDDLDGRIDMVLDAGPAWRGVESTVIEVRDRDTILYRPGAVAAEEIEAIVGPVVLYQPRNRGLHPTLAAQDAARMGHPQDLLPESLPSPGVDMRHYAPNAKVIPVEMGENSEDGQAKWLQAIQTHSQTGNRVGVLLPTGWLLPEGFASVRYAWGRWGDNDELARRLFAGLRELDAMGANFIVCPLPTDSGLGAAIRDRLLKAARAE